MNLSILCGKLLQWLYWDQTGNTTLTEYLLNQCRTSSFHTYVAQQALIKETKPFSAAITRPPGAMLSERNNSVT